MDWIGLRVVVVFQRVKCISADHTHSDPIVAFGEQILYVFNFFPKLVNIVCQRGSGGIK